MSQLDEFVDGVFEGSWKADLFEVPHEANLNERLEIYSRGFLIRSRQALENFFPQCARLMNPNDFERWGRAFVVARSSQVSNLNEVPEGFSEFLKEHGANLEWIELARLEEALAYSARCSVNTKLKDSELGKLNTDSILYFQDHLVLLSLTRPYHFLWMSSVRIDGLENQRAFYLIARDGERSRAVSVSQDEWECLQKLKSGVVLEDAVLDECEPQVFQSWLIRWAEMGLIVGMSK